MPAYGFLDGIDELQVVVGGRFCRNKSPVFAYKRITVRIRIVQLFIEQVDDIVISFFIFFDEHICGIIFIAESKPDFNPLIH